MRRRDATRLLGIGAFSPLLVAWTDKPKRTIALDLTIERLGRTSVTKAAGMETIEQDLELARRGAPLKKRKGRQNAKSAELVMERPIADDRFQELFRAWVESPDKRSMVLVIRDEGTPSEEPRGILKRFNLYGCWPKSWKISALDEELTDVQIEEMVVIVEWFEEA